jgi:excisionase family DNA binding protein
VSWRLHEPFTETPLVLFEQHGTKLREAGGRIVEGAEDSFPVLDRQGEDHDLALESVPEQGRGRLIDRPRAGEPPRWAPGCQRASLERGYRVSDRLLDAHEVAELLHVPVSWVRESTRSGAIPHVELGRYKRYREADVVKWLEECSRPGRPITLRSRP